MEKIVLWFKFDWCLFLCVQWTVSQHWFDNGLATKRWPLPEQMITHCNQNWVSSIASMLSNVAEKYLSSGPVFCLLLRVSSDYAQPITGQVTEVACPVIGGAQPELTPSKRQETGPGQLLASQYFCFKANILNSHYIWQSVSWSWAIYCEWTSMATIH